MISNTCFIEVNTVLNKMEPLEISKIPKDVLMTINQKANNQKIDIDTNKLLEEQISKDALAILTYIILKYIANKEQKDVLKINLTQNQLKYEKQQVPIKNIEEIFKNKEMTKELCVIEKESFIKKIMKKIIKFFKRNG